MPDLNWLAIVAAAVSAFVLGGLWYGPLFKHAWCREAGMDPNAKPGHPGRVFGVAGEFGTIAPGKRADLVLWDGDPLEVSTVAQQVWLDGRAIPMRSRQTELRDRYLRAQGTLPRAYPAGTD